MLKKILVIFAIIIIFLLQYEVYAKEFNTQEELYTEIFKIAEEPEEEKTGFLEQYGLDKSQFKPNTGKSSSVEPILGNALGVIRLIGIGVGIICISIMGIKFMLGSVEEKAEYKKTFVNFTIGILIFNGVIIIVSLIYSTLNYVNLNPWA